MPFNFPNQPSVLPKLNAPINDTVDTLTVDSWTYEAADTPSNFAIKIDNEYMFVGTRTGNTLSNIVRASEEPSVAAAHVTGAIVRVVLTRDAILDIAASVSPLVLFDRVIVPGGGASFISFAVIPGTHENLRLTLMGRTTQVATSTVIRARFNGDSGANYDYQQVFAIGATEDGNSAVADSFVPCGTLSGASAPANAASQALFEVIGYARTMFQKCITVPYGTKMGILGTSNSSVLLQGWWRNTAAISSIVLTPVSGDFAEGTVASLYGVA